MKKLILTLALSVLTSLLLTGCVQMHLDSEINKDGSGTASINMSLSQVVTESLDEISGMDPSQDMDLGALPDLTREELAKKVKSHGVKVKSFENGIVEGRQVLQVTFEFKDLEGFSYALKEVMGSEGDSAGMGIFKTAEGNFVLKSHDYDWPAKESAAAEASVETTPAAPEMNSELMQKQMELAGKLMGAMAEMDISMKITVPGDIIESNAPTVEGRTSIWTIDSSNMMSQDTDMEPNIVFSSKGLKIKPLQE